MKQLNITFSLSQYNEKHTIYLGNMQWLEHRSKTFMKLYLRTYKKVLLDNVRLLNTHNMMIYNIYRTFFFDLGSIEVERISKEFERFNTSFNWIFSNTSVSENSVIFSKISTCITINQEILKILRNHSQKNKNYSLKNQSEALLKMAQDFRDKCDDEKNSLNLDRNYTKDHLKLISDTLKKAM